MRAKLRRWFDHAPTWQAVPVAFAVGLLTLPLMLLLPAVLVLTGVCKFGAAVIEDTWGT